MAISAAPTAPRVRRAGALVAVLLPFALVACASPSGSPAGSSDASAQPSTPPSDAPAQSAAASAGDVSAAPPTAYDCLSLVSVEEMQVATGGDATATFLHQQLWTDGEGLPEGQTYCQYFAGSGDTSIAISVLTGPSFDQFLLAFESAPGGEPLTGIGDAAGISLSTGAGVARTGGIGVSVFTTSISGGEVPFDIRTTITALLNLLIGRV